ncbi:hypothetical protein PAHAL_3G409200 [Panicum hallii]|uniref:Uncharacterized protein n=1 Tax=Panicum hallii TaxID=206008 RepID=A0A2T8KKV8_9POAL|nr:hypothetical protein PAHAL_3G409200 [Panicum hallii]
MQAPSSSSRLTAAFAPQRSPTSFTRGSITRPVRVRAESSRRGIASPELRSCVVPLPDVEYGHLHYTTQPSLCARLASVPVPPPAARNRSPEPAPTRTAALRTPRQAELPGPTACARLLSRARAAAVAHPGPSRSRAAYACAEPPARLHTPLAALGHHRPACRSRAHTCGRTEPRLLGLRLLAPRAPVCPRAAPGPAARSPVLPLASRDARCRAIPAPVRPAEPGRRRACAGSLPRGPIRAVRRSILASHAPAMRPRTPGRRSASATPCLSARPSHRSLHQPRAPRTAAARFGFRSPRAWAARSARVGRSPPGLAPLRAPPSRWSPHAPPPGARHRLGLPLARAARPRLGRPPPRPGAAPAPGPLARLRRPLSSAELRAPGAWTCAAGTWAEGERERSRRERTGRWIRVEQRKMCCR